MANEEYLAILRRGVDAWNEWIQKKLREERTFKADLTGADFAECDFSGANFRQCIFTRSNFEKVNLAGADIFSARFDHANLSEADLSAAGGQQAKFVGARLGGANLRFAWLNSAKLTQAYLCEAQLTGAKLDFAQLNGADLSFADLTDASLRRTRLSDADLTRANLSRAIFYRANLHGVNLRYVELHETIFNDVDLSKVKALELCTHKSASFVDHRTLSNSRNIPFVFWRGCGLPDWQIEAARLSKPELTQDEIISITYEIARVRGEQPVQLFSPFISYSSKDDDFAKRLYNELQENGVRCWFAPEDMKIGDRIRRRIDEVIHLHDKLLLILSEHSLASEWVEDEVEIAFEKERKTGETVLFPIKLDNAVDSIETGWAAKLQRQRHIGDFTNWKDSDSFEAGFERVLRDLRAMP